jgi:hypothetical protein
MPKSVIGRTLDSPTPPFRFLDLPGEIRNRVYEIILCSFEPAPPSEPLGKGLIQIQSGRIQELVSGICPAVHSIETAILCTSKQVHREAYDVMVKANQFIHVRTTDISMSQLLIGSQVPIVTMDRAHADQFQGYVLRVNMSAVPGGWIDEYDREDVDMESEDFDAEIHARPIGHGPHFSFMILGRDWNTFCRMLAEADIYVEGFSTNVKLVLDLNPWALTLPNYKAPIADFFTPKTQEGLLRPFRSQLRGFIHVEINLPVPSALANAIQREVSQSPWTDPHKILTSLREAQDTGARFYDQGKITEASEHWTTAVSDVRRMRGSSSWSALVTKGGSAFVKQLVELQFELLLSSAQNSLRVIKASPNNKKAVMTVGDVVTSNLQEASDLSDDISLGEIVSGSAWRPSDSQMAKLYFMQAQCWRLMGEIDVLEDALHWIDMADDLVPNDAEIEQEKREVLAWAERVDEELRNEPGYAEWVAEVQGQGQQ